MAWRNLLRNRRRSLMTLVAMVLGLTSVLLFGGYIKDLTYGMQTDFVTRTGHLQIQHKDYHHLGSGNPEAFGIALTGVSGAQYISGEAEAGFTLISPPRVEPCDTERI